MHHPSAPLLSLLSLASALLASARASYLNNDLSFGHNNERISPNNRAVPNWYLVGHPDPPEILSNKLVLTPPVPGNQRGAVWAERPLVHSLWTAAVDFRATGPERGGGNLNIWYAKNGRDEVSTASIYTAGRFDGLALVIDQYAGSGGSIRGFLNDGTTDYKSHHNVDSLAFGHCKYAYRNLGRPSHVSIRQTADNFIVEIDGNLCFESSKIKLPLANFFGISAASAETPDSFEVFKFVTTTDTPSPDIAGQRLVEQQHQYGSAENAGQQQQQQQQQQGDGTIPAFSDMPDTAAEKYTSGAEQFADLHNRLQVMMKHISAISREVKDYQLEENRRHDTIMAKLHSIEAAVKVQEGTPNILKDIRSDVRQTKADLHEALNQHVAGLKVAVRDTHHSVLGTLAKTGTGLGKLVLVVVGSQGLLLGVYVLYKRRRTNMPKKYL
ncbi:Concanavalin A-like lectin [Venustampulla echinocandica]|uniref:Concanavalin A-like lectin n=1 Tax=Venustampulla echinocandica TaxID=2656787 RepID=A0A370TGX8_9HELO|nr:Concanavalin A-like lectin [Venustampulla echinocandica]RDL34452.1 Concanavalin A-like lectin [Venustampulla echinocandica]